MKLKKRAAHRRFTLSALFGFVAIASLSFSWIRVVLFRPEPLRTFKVRPTTATGIAVAKHDLDTLSALLAKHPERVDEQDDIGRTPLHWAVVLENESLLQYLLELGSNPYLADRNGDTPRELALELRAWQIATVLRSYEDRWRLERD